MKILVVSLSNIGDVVLTFPVIDHLRAAYPQAEISVVTGLKGYPLLSSNPQFASVIPYDKHMSWLEKLTWLKQMRQVTYDILVDLRHTALPILLRSQRSAGALMKSKTAGHMRDKHLRCLQSVFKECDHPGNPTCMFISDDEKQHVDALLKDVNGFVLMAPGAADHRKRWPEEYFVEVLNSFGSVPVVAVGSKDDVDIAGRIAQKTSARILNVCGQTSLTELYEVIRRCRMALVNDSGIMHMASYADKPIVAMFGPTDPVKYGPWSSACVALRAEEPSVQDDGVLRMKALLPEQVLNAFSLSETDVEIHHV